MKKRIWYIVAVLILTAIIVIRLKNNKEESQNRIYQYDKQKPISVQVDSLRKETVDANYSYSGSFESYKETRISAEIQGKINTILVDVGSHVKIGQPLIQLDNSLLKLQLLSVKAQVEGLEADVNRYKVLTDAEAIQGIQLEKSELALKTAQIQKATVLEQISKTTIKSPINGIITAKMTEEGAFAAPGIPLLQITDISKLKFTINLPEHDLNQFALKQISRINADAFPELSLSGEISMIGSKANIGNSFPVQYYVRNTPDLKIKSGMSGNAMVENMSKEKQIVIPSSSIIGTNIKPQVYKVTNGKAKIVDITITRRIGNKVIIGNGLSEGDVIVTNGFINLFDGANVSIKN